ncbi:MAG: thioesterase family protein [Acidobacteriia bacterium]|jgi:predicted thioesterase|nr:thioesterase family protein [Terriglobia bacterium]
MNKIKNNILQKDYLVTEEVTIKFMGPEVIPVLSTPALIMWLEMASREAAQPLLDSGEETVGINVQVKHLAPTPLGIKVRVKTKIVTVDGRRFCFTVEAFDEFGKIAEGSHERVRVLVSKFAKSLESKVSRRE